MAFAWDNILILSNFSPGYDYFILYQQCIRIWKGYKTYLILKGGGVNIKKSTDIKGAKIYYKSFMGQSYILKSFTGIANMN